MHRRRFPWIVWILALASLCALAGATVAQELANLIPNPRFAEGIASPSNWEFVGVDPQRVNWVQSEGRRAVHILGARGGSNGLVSDHFPVRPGETLTISAVVQCDAPCGTGDHLFVRFWNGGAFLGQQGPSLPTTPGTTTISSTMTAPARALECDVYFEIFAPSADVKVLSDGLTRGSRALPLVGTPGSWKPVAPPSARPGDANRNGLSDSLERLLNVPMGAESTRLKRAKTLSLQTGAGYRPDNDLGVDSVIVAGADRNKVASWKAMGYEPHVMLGFRDGATYAREHPEDVQTTRDGKPVTIDDGGYYLVPTARRRKIAVDYFRRAIDSGARAVCPEEPEFFAKAGYSQSFKDAFAARYGRAWSDPAESVAMRWRSERLKGEMETALLSDIWSAAKSMDPKVRRFLLTHSPLNYPLWDIVFPQMQTLQTGLVTDVVAQVWSGTARTPIPYDGRPREMTLAHAYLEYASSLALVKGRSETLWFLQDPLADDPNWSMSEYRKQYEQTLVAALLFPEVTHYETMPWPTRIYGRVPREYTVTLGTAIQTLSSMQSQTRDQHWRTAGPQGVAVGISDSLGYQRAAPNQSDLASVFGLSAPLVTAGIPIQFVHLDNLANNDSALAGVKLLLLSYDAQKPVSAAIHGKLAKWVANGGTLMLFGGDDAYNAAQEWWGENPTSHLLASLGWNTARRSVSGGPAREHLITQTDYTGHKGENKGTVSVDLSPLLKKSSFAVLHFADTLPDDGWGPLVSRVEADGIRDGKPVHIVARPGSPQEAELLAADEGSQLNPAGLRFADGYHRFAYAFHFDRGTSATSRIEIANQWRITGSSQLGADHQFMRVHPGSSLPETWPVRAAERIVSYPDPAARALYREQTAPRPPTSGESVNSRETGLTVLSEKAFGKGRVVYCGLPAAWFGNRPGGAARLRQLAGSAYGKGWSEPGALDLQRGDYRIACAFEKPLHLTGRFVNLLDPGLPVVTNPGIPTGRWGLFKEAASGPVLACSASIDWRRDTPTELRCIVTHAKGTEGVIRLAAHPRSVHLIGPDGKDRPVTVTPEGKTAQIRFANEPDGLGLIIDWK